jgi:hypothetical protein
MSLGEQLLKTITTQPNSDNMKYSFKIGIVILYTTYARFMVSKWVCYFNVLRWYTVRKSLFQILLKCWEDWQCIVGYQASSQTQTPWIHHYILVTVCNKMSLFATRHTKTSPKRQQCNSSQWLISSIHINAKNLKRWSQQGNWKSHFDSYDYFTPVDITDCYTTSGRKCSLKVWNQM